MKQALSSEGPARVRRQFRAITLGVGASALAMACSFGEIDPGDTDIDRLPPGSNDPAVAGPGDVDVDPTPGVDPTAGPGVTTPPSGTVDPTAAPYNPDEDPFSSQIGQEVKLILQTNCGQCHIGAVGAQGDFGYLLDMDQLITSRKIIPGNKEDSQLYNRMVAGTMPPAYQRVIQTPTYGQIDLVGQFIDELQLPDPDGVCAAPAFMGVDEQIELMQQDMASLEARDQPFTRYLTVTYSSNAGDCGRALERQRYALFKGINSVSTDPTVTQPQAINDDQTIFRIDIRDYGWDRQIDLQDNDISDPANVDFNDGWEAIIADPGAVDFAIEYEGDQADQLKADAATLVPFMPVNAFIQATEFGDLYYTLIGGKANLFDFEREVLGIDTAVEIADDNLLRAGFANSGVSKQERVLNRFDNQVAGDRAYWISFDFDGGNGGDVGNGGFEQNVANESIFDNPLDFAFAGGEAILNLPNGMQAYYVANAVGTRLATAPIGVVIDPAQNNGLVTNGASCHSCHNIGMITFTDTVRKYVIDNKVEFDNETFESVMAQYPLPGEFKDAMDRDSEVHLAATERAGVPRKAPDAVSRVYLDFQLGNIDTRVAAGELGVTEEVLVRNINLLDPRLATIVGEGGHVDRNIMKATFLDAVCTLQNNQSNRPVGCP